MVLLFIGEMCEIAIPLKFISRFKKGIRKECTSIIQWNELIKSNNNNNKLSNYIRTLSINKYGTPYLLFSTDKNRQIYYLIKYVSIHNI